MEEKLRQLGEEPGQEFFVSLDRLKRKLQTERIGMLIDNLEPALDSAGKFIEPHRRYVELLRVLTDPTLQSITLITSRERLNESSIAVQHYLLENLSLEAWKHYFYNRFQNFYIRNEYLKHDNESSLAALHKAYGGNAKAMDILCGVVLASYEGNIDAYWQTNQDDLLIERALEDLVISQFTRLQKTDSDAYKLLCRMGCYRYQDVPTIPIEGLICLLWDVPENRQRRVVKSLQDLALLEFEGGKYWLHPVIRGEAINQLRQAQDWKTANCKAAEFWTKSVEEVVTLEDAIKAFEAYYQFLEINDMDGAATVILRSRNNRWNQFLSLASSLNVLGLYQQVIQAISRILNSRDDISDSTTLSKLYHHLGNSYWSTGNLQAALEYQKKALLKLDQHLHIAKEKNDEYKEIIRRKIISLFCVGIYKIDLWRLKEASSHFSEVILLSENTEAYDIKLSKKKRILKAGAFLAFIKAETGFPEEAYQLAENVYIEVVTEEFINPSEFYFYLCVLGKAYSLLEEIQKARKLYHIVIANLEQNYDRKIKSRALSGLTELYRKENRFELAIKNHLKALELLQQIGAKPDLAEAYYQFGLTWQAMKEVEKSNENFQAAICLFTEMKAPKQIKRVRRSMMADADTTNVDG